MAKKSLFIVLTLTLTLSILCLFIITPLTAQTKSRASDFEAAMEILAMLNQWRLEEELTPFKPNTVLNALALYQAQFLISKAKMPNGKEMHTGRDGEGIAIRALYDDFNWAYYGRIDMITIGEIAAVNDAESSVAFWKSSKPHRDTVLNPAYREIGIAALPHPFGHLYIIVLGARPNVFPALIHPETGALHLTQELSRYAPNGGDWIQQIKSFRLFDESGRPLHQDWVQWDETVEIPEEAGDKVYIWYTDGSIESMSEVDLKQDRIVLPGYLPEPQFVAGAAAKLTAVPTLTPEPERPEVLLVYDKRSLSMINQSRKPINLADVDLEGECKVVRRARSNITAAQRFWLEADFDVLYDGNVITTCEVDAKKCEVDLP